MRCVYSPFYHTNRTVTMASRNSLEGNSRNWLGYVRIVGYDVEEQPILASDPEILMNTSGFST